MPLGSLILEVELLLLIDFYVDILFVHLVDDFFPVEQRFFKQLALQERVEGEFEFGFGFE